MILVDGDGFNPDYLGRVPTPSLDTLASRGLFGCELPARTPASNALAV